MKAYSPFPVVDDPGKFGLVAELVATSLGSVRVLRAQDRNDGDVLFLHGVGMCWDTWSPMLAAAHAMDLDTHRWVFVDLPGFGQSDPLRRPVTLPEVGAAVQQAVRAGGLGELHLVGHSMGGFLALDMASREKAASVVSFSGTYKTVVDFVNHPLRTACETPRAAGAYAGLQALSRLGPLASPVMEAGTRTGILRLLMRDSLARPSEMDPSLFRALARGVRPNSFKYAQATGVDYDVSERWSSIQGPALAVFGAHDVLISKRDRIAFEISMPRGRTSVLETAGHFAPVEDPHACARLVHQESDRR